MEDHLMKKNLALALIAAAAVVMPMTSVAFGQDNQQQVEKKKAPVLKIGDKAPSLMISEWVKGKPITGFENGQVYVVEFWATWCGPCIAGIPHLSEMQEKYKSKGLTIVGVNIWDDPSNVAPFMKDRGNKIMGYTVAIEEKIDGTDVKRTGKMDQGWMKPAKRRGIPSAFVVDQKGKIAYIGHPGGLDVPIIAILAGKWTPEIARGFAGAPEQKLEALNTLEASYPGIVHESAFAEMKLGLLMQAKEYDQAWKIAGPVIDHAIAKEDSQNLNSIAWTMVDPEGGVVNPDLQLALKAARAANKITGEQDPAILDTLARVYWLMGEKSHAIELQRKAVEHAEGAMKEGVSGTLKEYEEAIKTGG
jgi:thiol-disulfide isomerase/thioredoxin